MAKKVFTYRVKIIIRDGYTSGYYEAASFAQACVKAEKDYKKGLQIKTIWDIQAFELMSINGIVTSK